MGRQQDLAEAGVSLPARVPENLSGCLRVVCERYADALVVTEMGAAGGLTERGIEAAFQRHLGQPPTKVLTAVRLMHARRLLLASDQRKWGRVRVVARAAAAERRTLRSPIGCRTCALSLQNLAREASIDPVASPT